ncbi:hypothetical protein LRAMOSA05172 [Lichtheimia ramosa]|uniref:Cytochrome c oxidase assembly factor 3 n=1 Tax=Lichtheimia ramosa TaxID=688394 RepID=A0A077X1E0_9FUNG|nr:hypothetical protein LRAMOSA05172 [Lichtheimia ramosa]
MTNGFQREKMYTQSKGYGFSPALQRTRQPFRTRNMLTLLGLLTFTGGVFAYSMLAVKQDDFSDVPMPNTLPGVHDVTHENKDKQ